MSEKLNWAEWRLERPKGGVEMKGLKEFIEDLAKDNKLREKFKDLKDVKEIVSLAEKEGYEFTEDEYMDKQMENVSGGTNNYMDTRYREPINFSIKSLQDGDKVNIPIENMPNPEAILKLLKGNQ